MEKCKHCTDGFYYGLNIIEKCEFCGGTGKAHGPTISMNDSKWITVSEIKELIDKTFVSMVMGTKLPTISPRKNFAVTGGSNVILTPEQHPNIEALDKCADFQNLMKTLTSTINSKLHSIRGGLWRFAKRTSMTGEIKDNINVDWTNFGKNPRKLRVKAQIEIQ